MKNKQKDVYIYPVIFRNVGKAGFAILVPDLDVATCAETEEKAFIAARELIGITILGLEEDKEEIPLASSLQSIQLEKDDTVSLIDVFMPSIRLANKNKAVNRTVTLPAWLNAKALEYNINFSQLLQEAIKKELHL